mmetsp:Transcript_25507/g.60219  ORF Transcript_25507/g.60219 Transcript_25507/m.60219 type:complete len:180 (-) Transcript_25507:718-1257(-)
MVELLKHLVGMIPDDSPVKSFRQVRYSVIKYDLEQVCEALVRITNELMERKFSALEPKRTRMQRIIDEINGAKINAESPTFVTPSWGNIGKNIHSHIIAGSVQDQPVFGGVNAPLPPSAKGIITPIANANIKAVAQQHLASKAAAAASGLKTFSFKGTMDKKGNLIGTLVPQSQTPGNA